MQHKNSYSLYSYAMLKSIFLYYNEKQFDELGNDSTRFNIMSEHYNAIPSIALIPLVPGSYQVH